MQLKHIGFKTELLTTPWHGGAMPGLEGGMTTVAVKIIADSKI